MFDRFISIIIYFIFISKSPPNRLVDSVVFFMSVEYCISRKQEIVAIFGHRKSPGFYYIGDRKIKIRLLLFWLIVIRCRIYVWIYIDFFYAQPSLVSAIHSQMERDIHSRYICVDALSSRSARIVMCTCPPNECNNRTELAVMTSTLV